jgi:hypothetical protein
MPSKPSYRMASIAGVIAFEAMTMDIARATPGSDIVLDSVVIDVTGDNFPGVRDAGDAFRISITDSVVTTNGQFN